MKIAMCSIPVNDPIKAFKHYTEILGFQEMMYDPQHQLAIVLSPEDKNGVSLMLEPNTNPISKAYQEGLYNSGIPCITLGTDDIKAEYIRLVNLDVAFKKEPTLQSWGWEAIFDDGQGNWIQIIQT